MKTEEKDLLLEKEWLRFGDIPMNPETETMDEEVEFRLGNQRIVFDKGTDRMEIWHWFDENHSKGVQYLLYGDPKNEEPTSMQPHMDYQTIHVCPNHCRSPLITTAHVSQTWKVDHEGEFLEEISTDEVDAEPDDENIWTCEKCGAEAECLETMKVFYPGGAVYYPVQRNGFKYVGYPLTSIPLLPQEEQRYRKGGELECGM